MPFSTAYLMIWRCAAITGGEEGRHVVDLGVGLFLVQGRDRLQRQLRRHLALRVAAHAIGQQKDARGPRVAVAHAVFVELAAALARDLKNRKFHLGLITEAAILFVLFLVSVTMVSNWRRTFSATTAFV
jgi:hypothetical protein